MTRWILSLALLGAVACDDATIASQNISRASDNFEVDRRIVFLNGITDEYLLTIEGRCSIHDEGHQLEVTCRVAEDDYRKHFLGLSDNVTYFAEQLSPGDVSVYHYRLTFKPQVIVPDYDFRGDAGALFGNESEAMQ
ncbi:MAG: hypothetical protein OXD30_07095 [Bryobacterales bacterium]|nr:hypothetical protein [Bryobacterales bacterium]